MFIKSPFIMYSTLSKSRIRIDFSSLKVILSFIGVTVTVTGSNYLSGLLDPERQEVTSVKATRPFKEVKSGN